MLVVKTYPGGVIAVNNVSFSVNQGEFFALLGPNGAGKTTTIGVICSLVNKTAGSVSVLGNDLDTQRNDVKKQLGLVPQEFNFNIFEKVIDIVTQQAGYYGIPYKVAYQRAKHYLKKLNLWDKRNTVSRMLSGGMKRRLMIARALVSEPKILILDEPTAGVDIELRRYMWDFLREINTKGTTIILTTHYLEEAENLCKKIAIIDKGILIEYTEMSTLLQKLALEQFILYLSEPIDKAPTLKDFQCTLIDNITLEIDLYAEQNMNDLFAQLTKAKIKVNSMKNKSGRLEELFISLTGKKPESNGEESLNKNAQIEKISYEESP